MRITKIIDIFSSKLFATKDKSTELIMSGLSSQLCQDTQERENAK